MKKTRIKNGNTFVTQNITNNSLVPRTKRSYSFSAIKGLVLTLLSFILLIGLVSNLSRIAQGEQNRFTFSYMLSLIQNYEPYPFSNTIVDLTIRGEWVILDGLRVFINNLSKLWSTLLFLILNVENCIKFFLHFIIGLFF